MNMQIIARGWLVYSLTSSAMDLAWVTLSFMLPSILFSLYGGVLADRLSKRKVIVCAQSLNCLATLIMAAIIFSEAVTFWDFIWFGFFNGTILALSMPSRHAFVPELIPEKLIFTAMALNTTGWNLSRIIGPAFAGLLIAWLAGGDKTSSHGVGIVYLVIASLYLMSALTVLRVDRPGLASQQGKTGTFNEMREGLVYVGQNPKVFALIILSIVPFLFGMPLNTLLPAFNEDVLGGHADSLGLLISAMGAGAIIGSILMAGMGDLKRKGLWLLLSCDNRLFRVNSKFHRRHAGDCINRAAQQLEYVFKSRHVTDDCRRQYAWAYYEYRYDVSRFNAPWCISNQLGSRSVWRRQRVDG